MSRREAERDRLRGQLRRQIAIAYATIERLELFRDRLIPRTKQTLDVATAEYQGKQADFTDLIDIYQELLSYEVQVARTKATLASTLAQIETIVGCETGAKYRSRFVSLISVVGALTSLNSVCPLFRLVRVQLTHQLVSRSDPSPWSHNLAGCTYWDQAFAWVDE